MEKCERNLEENRINKGYTQRIKKMDESIQRQKTCFGKGTYELYDQLYEINGSIVK